MPDSTINAFCKVCGKGYHVCNSCQSAASFTPWRTLTDTMDCYKIFLVIRDFTNGHLTRAEAAAMLHRLDLSKADTFVPEMKDVITNLVTIRKVP